IELITNPSAKYNPEGMSGIINIVLHKSAADGFNASVNTGLTIGIKPKVNNSMNMNYRRGWVNFFATYGNNFGKFYNTGQIDRPLEEIYQQMDIVNDDNSHLFKVGMDFYLDDRNTISV
ncbi:MAG TPA: TonB-dependent receptor, partial [Flavobacterium sp.]|nr:TonB-dependent receptor [Flavobacterium sp.]